MGWLFGKKKVPRVPFPEPRALDEGSLKFPSGRCSEKIIEPEQFKLAAGVGKELPMPSEPNPDEAKKLFASMKKPLARSAVLPKVELPPVYVKVEVYQRVLGEIESLRKDLVHLHATQEYLHTSEYNEEANFTKLRRAVRGTHDRLLQIDKILFKIQGE